MKSTLCVLTTALLLLFSYQIHAQIPNLGGVKSKVKSAQKSPEEKKAAKIEKSEAKEEIISVEAAMMKLNSFDSKKRDDNYFGKNEEQLKEFEQPYFALRDTLPLLKKKDSKWKTQDYDEMLAKCDKRYPAIQQIYKTNEEVNEVLTFIKSKMRKKPKFRFGYNYSCSSLDEKWSNYYAADCPCADMHYDFYVNELELKKLRQQMQKYKDLDPEGFNEALANSYNDAWEHYWKNFEQTKVSWLERTKKFLAKAEAESKGKEFHVIGILNYHKRIMESMIDSEDTPDQRFVDMLKEVESMKEKVRAVQMAENHVTKERVGTILFTKDAVSREQIEGATPVTEWTIDQPLYFRWFMGQSPLETHGEIEGYEADLYSYRNAYEYHVVTIDGKEFYSGWFRGFGEGDKDLYKSALTMRGYYDLSRSFYADMLKKLIEDVAPGKHQVKIDIYIANSGTKTYSKEPVASGEITMNVTSTAIANVMKSEEICYGKAGMRNASLEAKMIALFKEKGWKETPKKAVILSSSWNISKNKYTSAIIKRWVEVEIISVRDGECIKQVFNFSQDYAGGGSYSGLYMDGIGDQDTISCKCLR